jgi:hypothetical protein
MACLLGRGPLKRRTSGKKSSHSRSLRTLIGIFSLVFLSVGLLAQQTIVLAPHKPFGPKAPYTGKWKKEAVPRSMVGGLWMIDANFKSSIYIKNGVEVSAVTVTPILYLGNGAKYNLPDVNLEPAGTAVVHITEGLRHHGIALWATLSAAWLFVRAVPISPLNTFVTATTCPLGFEQRLLHARWFVFSISRAGDTL